LLLCLNNEFDFDIYENISKGGNSILYMYFMCFDVGF
jgi:hypothetical protein